MQLGEEGELSACFDPETLTYPALWKDGFLEFSSVRHGFMNGLIPKGTPLAKPQGEKPHKEFQYRGFYRYGKRVLFAYRIGNEEFLDSPWVEKGEFVRTVAPVDQHPLKAALQGSPLQWPEEVETPIRMGEQIPYAIDTIELPHDNPWNALLFCGDHDFLPDGSALVCTMQGDVWHVSGLNEGEKAVGGQATWRRFAAEGSIKPWDSKFRTMVSSYWGETRSRDFMILIEMEKPTSMSLTQPPMRLRQLVMISYVDCNAIKKGIFTRLLGIRDYCGLAKMAKTPWLWRKAFEIRMDWGSIPIDW